MLDYVFQFTGEPKKVKIKIVNFNIYLIAHKGIGFDSFVVSNNLPQWRTVVSLVKNGAGIVSLKIFNGYVDPVKKVPQYVQFRSGLFQIEDFLWKIGTSYKLQKCLL